MSFADLVNADIRLVILMSLAQAAGYCSNEYILHRFIEISGHKIPRDQMLTQLAWLKEQSLVTLQDGGVLVATLTARGLDAAEGRATIPGVQRPSPQD